MDQAPASAGISTATAGGAAFPKAGLLSLGLGPLSAADEETDPLKLQKQRRLALDGAPAAAPRARPASLGESPEAAVLAENAGISGNPPPTELDAALVVGLKNEVAKGRDDPGEAGSFHVQLAHDRNFTEVAFDRVYLFVEDLNIHDDAILSGVSSGVYWIRMAFIDLLNVEHAFTKPKGCRVRRPR